MELEPNKKRKEDEPRFVFTFIGEEINVVASAMREYIHEKRKLGNESYIREPDVTRSNWDIGSSKMPIRQVREAKKVVKADSPSFVLDALKLFVDNTQEAIKQLEEADDMIAIAGVRDALILFRARDSSLAVQLIEEIETKYLEYLPDSGTALPDLTTYGEMESLDLDGVIDEGLRNILGSNETS